MASEIKVDTISEKTSANGVTIDSLSIKDGGLVAAGNIDVNGNNLVLDANANTYLDAGTDDTIKVYVSGAEDLRIAANAINVLSGTTLTIDSGATITNSGTANGFGGADPSSADGDTLGTASAEWSDLYLADGGVVYFGNDQDVTLTHNADTGLTLNGVMVATTVEPSADTSSGDNAAIGYTSAEGLILTGQGSTSDVTLKNDADGTVFTVPTGTDDILFPDNAKAIWGAGSDLQIYHDGSDSYIVDNGTGNLALRCGDFSCKNVAGDEVLFKADQNGAFKAYYDNALKAETVTGGFTITGAISKSSGSFKIDHPLPNKKDTHYLVHSFVESPRADLIYRGKVTLSSGTATVNIDTAAGMSEGTFVVLCDDIQCFTTNESDWDVIKGSVTGNILTIESQNPECNAEISWMVLGDRKDEHMLDTDWTDGSGKPIIEPLQPEPEEE